MLNSRSKCAGMVLAFTCDTSDQHGTNSKSIVNQYAVSCIEIAKSAAKPVGISIFESALSVADQSHISNIAAAFQQTFNGLDHLP